MSYQEIVNAAQESYARYFRNVEPITEEKTNDALVDVVTVKKIIEQGEGHLAALKNIKKEIEEEAKVAEEKIFNEDAKKSLDQIENDYVVYQAKLNDFKAKLEALKK